MKRVYHTWEKWECYPAGFYGHLAPEGMKTAETMHAYADFLRDSDAFAEAIVAVLEQWPNSSEHYLSNENMNRLAWLGQASACIALKIPASFRGGFNLLSEAEQATANTVALEGLNRWLEDRGEPTIPVVDEARSKTQVELY